MSNGSVILCQMIVRSRVSSHVVSMDRFEVPLVIVTLHRFQVTMMIMALVHRVRLTNSSTVVCAVRGGNGRQRSIIQGNRIAEFFNFLIKMKRDSAADVLSLLMGSVPGTNIKRKYHITNNNRKTGVKVLALVNGF